MPAPSKRRDDTVGEAVFELRFGTTLLPDLVVGMLAGLWPKLNPVSNQLANIPAAIRRGDEGLRNQPLMDLQDKSGRTLINMGEGMIAFHTPERYPGWEAFRADIEANLKKVRDKLPGLTVERLGLRYINMFPEGGRVSNFSDFPLEITLGGAAVEPPIMLFYSVRAAKDLTLNAKIASRGFINENADPSLFAVADYDASTPSPLGKKSSTAILAWAERAHTLVKSQYAKLVPNAF